jgi:aryl-alcohol dehydrogenase-like predicted oxidoreductase
VSELRQLGPSGLQVSAVGLGTNNFGRRLDQDQTKRVVDAALDAGITFFDTANIYGGGGDSERFLGSALGGRRSSVIIGTKFGMPMPGEDAGMQRGTREYIRAAVTDSLRRLGTDYIDLYQLHQPDPGTPVEETLGALNELAEEGLVRAFGCSNFDASQVRAAQAAAQTAGTRPFVSVQNEYSWLRRDAETDAIPVCIELGLGFIPFFPLASGVLTGKYRRGEQPPQGSRLAGRSNTDLLSEGNFDVVDRLQEVAAEAGVSLLAIAIGGLAAMPGVTSVIAGATSPEQVRSNAEAGAWRPTPAVLEEIRKSAQPGGEV